MKPGDVPGLTAREIMGFSHYLEPMSQIHGDLDTFTRFSHIFWKKPYKIPEPLTFSQTISSNKTDGKKRASRDRKSNGPPDLRTNGEGTAGHDRKPDRFPI